MQLLEARDLKSKMTKATRQVYQQVLPQKYKNVRQHESKY